MATIQVQDFCRAVYCTTTTEAEFAPSAVGRISAVARSVDDGGEEYYRVEFDGITNFSWRDDGGVAHAPRPGDLFEFSVIELDPMPAGWRVWIMPLYCSEVEFSCTGIRLNGAIVVGDTRWLQDELPRVRPVVPPFQPAR